MYNGCPMQHAGAHTDCKIANSGMGYRPDKPYNGSDRLRRLLPERRCWVSGYPGCRNSQTVLTQLVEMKDQDVWLVHVSVLSGGKGFLTAGLFYGSAERGYLTNTHIGLIIYL